MGGNGESNAWTRASPMCVQSRYIRSQASPSPGWSRSSPSAVSRGSCWMRAHPPPGSGLPTTAGAWDQVNPNRSRFMAFRTGEAAARG